MASDRPPEVLNYSPVPASTYNLKEKFKHIFLEEAQYLYQTFVTVNSVSLIGTLSISINGNEDIGVIEVSETTERVPGSDTFTHPQYDGDGGFNDQSGGKADAKTVSGISKMVKPFPLPPMPKVFDKQLFDKVTSLGQLQLMRKYADFDQPEPSSPASSILAGAPSTDTRWTGTSSDETEAPAASTAKQTGKSDSEKETNMTVESDLEDVADDLTEDEDTIEEDNEDKKDEDYTPELGDDAVLADDAEDVDKDVDEDWLKAKRRSKRKIPRGIKRKTVTRPVIPKKRGRKTAAKLSLKIKLKKLTSIKSKKKVKKIKLGKDGKDAGPKEIPADLTCTICQKKFDTKRSFKRHCDRHWKSFQCDECGKPFSSMDSLTHHKRGLHSATKPYSCEECGTSFNFHHSYKLHMRKHRGERPYQCDQCQKSYLTATHLKAHKEAIHETGTKSQFVCDTCGKTFTYRNSLKTHQMIHTGDRPFKCSICEKGFVTRQALKTHEESYHTQERNFQCDICFKFYKSEHLRNVHRRRHTSDVNRFMCDICGRQFMFKSNLDAHSFVHQDDRPFVCNICQKSFKCMSSLYTHQYTHKTTTPYKCNICNKTFKTKNCCKAHEKRHNAEKNFMCSTCGACFPDKGGMTKHIRTIHSPQKQFVCKFCGKIGTRADNMRTHIKSHGKEIGDLETAECIIEVPTSAPENIHELANKSLELSRQMKQKGESDSQNFIAAPSQKVPPQTAVYSQAPNTSSNLPPNPNMVSLPPPVTYHTPQSSQPDPVYQAPVSSNPQIYQPPISPTTTYHPPLSPHNYPHHVSPPRTSPTPHMLPTRAQHPDPIQTTVGQSHTLQPLVTVSDPMHMDMVERAIHPLHVPMPAHMQSHDHGPPVFPLVHPHGQIGDSCGADNM